MRQDMFKPAGRGRKRPSVLTRNVQLCPEDKRGYKKRTAEGEMRNRKRRERSVEDGKKAAQKAGAAKSCAKAEQPKSCGKGRSSQSQLQRPSREKASCKATARKKPAQKATAAKKPAANHQREKACGKERINSVIRSLHGNSHGGDLREASAVAAFKKGIDVRLIEISRKDDPPRVSEFSELVCSNSLRSDELQTPGL